MPPEARDDGVFLACRGDFIELWRPPVLRRFDIIFSWVRA